MSESADSKVRRERESTVSLRSVPTQSARPQAHARELDRFPLADPARYEVHGEIARGGLGRILNVRDLWLEREIAIKELLGSGPEAEARFIREATITAGLTHPAIIPLHEAGRWPTGQPFYTMKLITGRSLREVIAGTDTLEERLSLLPNMTTVADAVAYAHSQGVVHRDLKPANILVGPFGETLVIDWGLTKALASDREHERGMEDPLVTSPGGVVGTPAFMPPEQAQGKEVDQRADVYALGAVLYQLLSGAPPYSGERADEVLSAVSARAPMPLAERVPDVPEDLAAIVDRAMARAAGDRYPSAFELAEDLRRFLSGQLVSAHRYSGKLLAARWLRRHRAIFLLSAVALLLLMIGASVAMRRVLDERTHAVQRANELTLEQARSALTRDPTRALAWLKTYPPSADDSAYAADIAADAESRGVARHVLHGHQGTVRALAFSPDGKTLASISDDQTLRLWDTRTYTQLAQLDERQQSLGRVVYSADGQWLASAGVKGVVWLWQPQTGRTQRLVGHEQLVLDLSFSADARTLVTASSDGTVRVWDVERGSARVLTGHRGPAEAARILPDGKRVVSCGRDGSVRLWNLENAQQVTLATHTGTCEYMALSDNGTQLASAGSNSEILTFVLAGEAQRERVLSGQEGPITALTFAADSRHLAAAGEDGSVRIWDVRSGEGQVVAEHEAEVRGLAFSPDDRLLVSSDFAGVIQVFDRSQHHASRLLGHGTRVYSLAFSPEGRSLASGSNDATVRIWPLAKPRDTLLSGFEGEVYHALYSPDGSLIATDGADRTVRIFSRGGELIHTLHGHEDTVCSLAFSRRGEWLVSSSWDGTVRLWDVVHETERVLSHAPGVVWHAAFSHDGRHLAAADTEGTVSLWDTQTFVRRVLRGHEGDVQEVEFSPDGKTLASAGLDGTIRLWDVQTGLSRRLMGHTGRIYAIAFSRNGHALASAGRDGSVRLWTVASGAGRIVGKHEGAARDVLFAREGQMLISGGEDHTLRLWHLPTQTAHVLRGHDDVVRSLALAPNERVIASGGHDGSVRLWDLETGARAVLRGHRSLVTSVAFAPDGRQLASSGADRSVRLIDMTHIRWVPSDGPSLYAWLEQTTTVRNLH